MLQDATAPRVAVVAQHAGTGADARGRLIVQVNDGTTTLARALLLETLHVDAAAVTNVPQLAVGAVCLENQGGTLVLGPTAGATDAPALGTPVTTPVVSPLRTALYAWVPLAGAGGTVPVGPQALAFNTGLWTHPCVTLLDERTLCFQAAGAYRLHVQTSLVVAAGVTQAAFGVSVVAAGTGTALALAPGTGAVSQGRGAVSAAASGTQETVLYLPAVAAQTTAHLWLAPEQGSPLLVQEVRVVGGVCRALIVHYLGTPGV